MQMRNRNSHFNPLTGFEKVWKLAERFTVTTAFIVVFGTLGFVSVHALA
jgi:hypothetical protein